MSNNDALLQLNRRVLTLAVFLALVVVGGTFGYRQVGPVPASWIDCLYMTVITITTIGYGEVIDMSHSPGGRVFTMAVALSGIGMLTYILGSVTTLAVDGEFQRKWRRRKMEQRIATLQGHYVVCGWGGLGPQLVRELQQTQREFVLLTEHAAAVAEALGEAPEFPLLEGDPTDDELLKRAGLDRAAGCFAVADDDHLNVVIALSAHALHSGLRIVASVRDQRNADKLRKAGATTVISPNMIGGMRMASEMIRPATVSFLDTMLRDREKGLRVEDVPVASAHAGKSLSEFGLERFEKSLLVAVRRAADWSFKPAPDYRLASGDVLVFMTTAEERKKLVDVFAGESVA